MKNFSTYIYIFRHSIKIFKKPTSLKGLKRKPMEVKPGSSVVFNNLKAIYGKGQLIYVRHVNNIHEFRLFPVNFVVYKSNGDLLLESQIITIIFCSAPSSSIVTAV